MADMFDYLDWRGDITFNQSPFNEIDGLILTWLSYVHFDGIISSDMSVSKAISLKDAEQRFFMTHDLEKIMKLSSFTRTSAVLLQKLAKTDRYKDIRLMGFENKIDYEKEMQFAVFTVILPDDTFFVDFRGTDETIVGWKEDFNVFLPVLPAQGEALNYLERLGKEVSGKIRIGGHSKGGNLAIYAASLVSKKVRKRIMDIYNYDGPGFYEIELLGESYKELVPIIHTFVPEMSIIGMLLSRYEDYTVVKSVAKSFNQHDETTWQVKGTHFETLPCLADLSRMINDALTNWVKELSRDDIYDFVQVLFDILDASGARTVDDLNAEKWKTTQRLVKEYVGLEKNKKDILAKTLSAIFREGGKTIKNEFSKQTIGNQNLNLLTNDVMLNQDFLK